MTPPPMGTDTEAAPVDDADDRLRILGDVGANLFVEAGAGTGKTHELVGRVVELVAGGALPDIRGLAAITFTEKAAAELRDRIRRGLEAAAGDPQADDDRRDRCRRALDGLDDAPVGTLHGFALRILSEFPIEAGLPPGFEVADPVVAAVEFNERWARFVDELFADEALEPVLRRGFTMHLKLSSLREVATELHEHWDRLADLPEGAAATTPTPVDVTAVIDQLEACTGWAETCPDGDKLARRVLEDLPPFLARLRAAAERADESDQLTLLVDQLPVLKSGAVGARTAQIDELRARLARARQAVADLVADLRRGVLLPLLDRLRRFTLDGAAERRRRGRLEFADLLVHAAQVLERDGDVRFELSRRWPVVLVDEFQDTDPLQIRIATLLTLADPASAPARWEDSVCAAGRLFVVGDPKQSIYRFRRADIALYDRAREAFPDGQVQLNRNFRTVPEVLAWINAVFQHLFGDGIREQQPGYRPLAAAREPLRGAGPPVVVLGGPATDVRVSEVREIEAGHIARWITELVGGTEQVTDAAAGPRPLRFDDIAVLLPTRASLSELERAFEGAGVPYRIESRSLVFVSDEVRELLTILQAVDHPGDAVALVGALRTPAFGCSDRDLAEYRWAGGRWSVRLPFPDGLDASHPVPAALAAIGRYHQIRQWLPVNELLERIIRERGMVELTLSRLRPRDHWRRYRLLLEEARAFVAGGGATVGDFVRWAEQQADEEASRTESIVPEADDHAVRVLTVHAAKGLEFPVAVVAGLNAQLRSRAGRVLWPSPAAPPEVRVGLKDEPFETAGYERAAEYETGMDELERLRLLYVATTRARDRLVVSLHHKAGTQCHAAHLWAQMESFGHLVAHIEPTPDGEASGAGRPRPLPVVEASEPMAERLAGWDAERHALLARAAERWVVAPSQLALDPDAGSDLEQDHDSGLEQGIETVGGSRPRRRRGRAATAIGRAVHAVLQVVDLADPAGLDELADVQAVAEGVAEHAGLIAALVRSALGAPAVREAARGRCWREVFVSAPLADTNRLVEGYIDLLYETTDRDLVVVDYKTDRADTDAELDAAMAHHRHQGAAYAAAVESALDRKVARVVFVFAREGEAVERQIDDVSGAVADLDRQLRTW